MDYDILNLMETLIEIVKKPDLGRRISELVDFFQGLIDKKIVNAYLVEVNKKVEEDDDFIKLRKGAVLSKTEALDLNHPYFIEDPKTRRRYNLDFNKTSSGSGWRLDQHYLTIERLIGEDYRRISYKKDNYRSEQPNRLRISTKEIDAKLKMSYVEELDVIDEREQIKERNGSLILEGISNDPIFDIVLDQIARPYKKEIESRRKNHPLFVYDGHAQI